jgi:hypothetical protein
MRPPLPWPAGRRLATKGPDLAQCLKEMEQRVRRADERVRFVYFGFDAG